MKIYGAEEVQLYAFLILAASHLHRFTTLLRLSWQQTPVRMSTLTAGEGAAEAKYFVSLSEIQPRFFGRPDHYPGLLQNQVLLFCVLTACRFADA